MRTVEDTIYNADGTVTIVYSDGTISANNVQTGGTYQTGGNSTTPGSYTTPGKKWWETALGVLPGILTGIFGGNANAGTNYPTAGYYPATTTGNSNNMLIIVAVAVVVVFLLMKKK